MQVLEKVTQLVLKKINSEREDMESRSGARNEMERTSSPEDTMEVEWMGLLMIQDRCYDFKKYFRRKNYEKF
jgi:hypothetical protein